MKLFLSELQYLSEIYARLEGELAHTAPPDSKGEPDALIAVLEKNSDLLARIQQMDERVAQLAVEWVRYRDHLTPDAYLEVRSLAERVREQAASLSRLCGNRIDVLRGTLDRIERYLGQVRAGNRLLDSLKGGVRVAEPRFIDREG